MVKKLSRTIRGRRMEHRPIAAVGVWFYALSTDRYLYLLRNDKKHPGTWGLPGGKVEKPETLLNALERECREELNFWPEPIKLAPIEQFTSPDGHFTYHTFFSLIENEFSPTLNHEHFGYAWIDSGHLPNPMHPGLWSTTNIKSVKMKVNTLKNSYKSQYDTNLL